ncbi:MAG TPA: hypothetical protein VIS06_18410 [Mycobacteriales bacterium]
MTGLRGAEPPHLSNSGMADDQLGLALGNGQEIEQRCARCGQYCSAFAAITYDVDTGELICPACSEHIVPGWPELVRAIDQVHDAICYVGRPAEGADIAAVLRALADRVDDLTGGRAAIVTNTNLVGLEGVSAERYILTHNQVSASSEGAP